VSFSTFLCCPSYYPLSAELYFTVKNPFQRGEEFKVEKVEVLAVLRKRLKDKERELKALIKDLQERRNDAPSRNESRYDSSKAELQYSINAYARRLEEVRLALERLEGVHVGKSETVGLGSIVSFSNGLSVFVLPCCGGEKVEAEGRSIVVITPSSPIFGLLRGKRAGERVKLPSGEEVLIKEDG
jgi:transcription elongation GreA/GreB family factor